MQDYATERQNALEYYFLTTDPKMKAWALDPVKGYGIFNWDEIETDKNFLRAKKVIFPIGSILKNNLSHNLF